MKILCFFGLHKTRSVGYGVNDKSFRDGFYDLHQCYRCSKVWKREVGFLERSLLVAAGHKAYENSLTTKCENLV
jgi:hypothetical protein